ncbi:MULTISPECIES: DUF1062 domain-containing protein [unclassified Rhizobium]|uniref:DUF1062 domain-containing protein n=1 Tax=unclassified Rhizobium TaxID=2613769 RepID=UPI000CF28AF2|nr:MULTISPECIES: DUF1062 domain-containing protein [Rhizobium]MDK4739311.1 DUF1062 domain-containing protein [Rhizobium sp. CNPSo 3464]UWU22359.1 DUF1062 domain-containing protein [Rhizobium tropici]
MCNSLKVRWTINPRTAPQPWIVCSGCGCPKPFKSSGKTRLNANGKKLDAWLVYKCVDCDKTWNRTLFERQTIRDLDPLVLEALQGNDSDWIRAREFDLDALRRKTQRIDEFADADVEKEILSEPDCWTMLEIDLAVTLPFNVRLDRLLASELNVSRSRLQALHEDAKLRVHTDRADAMRRRIKNGSCIVIDLSDEADRHLIWKAAVLGKEIS